MRRRAHFRLLLGSAHARGGAILKLDCRGKLRLSSASNVRVLVVFFSFVACAWREIGTKSCIVVLRSRQKRHRKLQRVRFPRSSVKSSNFGLGRALRFGVTKRLNVSCTYVHLTCRERERRRHGYRVLCPAGVVRRTTRDFGCRNRVPGRRRRTEDRRHARAI